MHSICHTGDIFGSKRCDCGFQLKQAMKMIAAQGTGALFYLANHDSLSGRSPFNSGTTFTISLPVTAATRFFAALLTRNPLMKHEDNQDLFLRGHLLIPVYHP